MKRFLKEFGITLIGVVVSMIVLAASLVNAMIHSSATERDQIQNQLVDLTQMEVDYIQTKMGDLTLRGVNLALAVSKFDDITSESVRALFLDVMESSNVTDIFLTLPDGSMYFADEIGFEIASRVNYTKSRLGETYVSEVYTLPNDMHLFAITVPVMRSGNVIGIITAVYETDLLAKIIDITSFDGKGYIHIFQEDGTFVARSTHAANLIDSRSFFYIENANFEDGGSYDELRKNIETGKSGFINYNFSDNNRYAYYTPVGAYGWYVITVVPLEVVQEYSDISNRQNILLSIQIVAGVLILMICVVIDIRNRQKKLVLANEQLNLSDERFRIAMSHVSYLVFEYDFDNETITVLNNREDVTKPISEKQTIDRAVFESTIFQDDLEKVQRLIDEVKKGATAGTVYFRMRPVGEKEYRWFNLILSGVFDKRGQTVQGVGTLEDINDQRIETLRLREKADTDPLTGIYNRAATERLVDSIIMESDPESKYAFLVIDLDHFKDINDNLGHLYGDEILKEVSSALYTTFRSSDIVGRLGGDEFCVFLKGVNNAEIIRRKLRKPLASLANPDLHKGYPITLSIGVVFGDSEDNFVELYRKGDLALYDAKQQGRNCIAVYEDE